MLLELAAGARDLARRPQLPRLRRARRRSQGAGLELERHRTTASIRMPSGPAVVITPWNAPFMLSTWKTAPALAAGCTVVLKPAEWSPLSCSLLADLAPRRGFRRASSTSSRESARASARRSSPTRWRGASPSPARRRRARAIGKAAAGNLVPFTGELGGKGPLLVFDDADLDDAAALAARMYDDCGQVCLAGTRLLVAGLGSRAISWSASTPRSTRKCSATRASPRRRFRR